MLCRMLEGELTCLHQAFTWTACQALVCVADCQLLRCNGMHRLRTESSYTISPSIKATFVVLSWLTARILTFAWQPHLLLYSATVVKCQDCVKKCVKVAMPQEKYDLIDDAAHGISGSSAVGQISLQGSQPVLNTTARIPAPSLADRP